jgi:hypothetical protein
VSITRYIVCHLRRESGERWRKVERGSGAAQAAQA